MIDVSQTPAHDRSLATAATRLARAEAHDGTTLASRATGDTASAATDAVATAGPSAAEAGATAARLRELAHAGALLQTADAALAEIGDRLDRLAEIAEEASDTELSTYDRSQLDVRFQELRAEIDTIAGAARFDGQRILQGGTGTDGAFALSTAVDPETGGLQVIEIAEVSIEELDAGLPTASVASAAEADAAASSVEAAQASLADIRTSVGSQLRQIGTEAVVNRAAETSAAAVTAREESIEKVYEPPQLAKDIAEQVARQGGVDLSGGAERTLRQLLLTLTRVGVARPDAAPDGHAAPALSTADPAPALSRDAAD